MHGAAIFAVYPIDPPAQPAIHPPAQPAMFPMPAQPAIHPPAQPAIHPPAQPAMLALFSPCAAPASDAALCGPALAAANPADPTHPPPPSVRWRGTRRHEHCLSPAPPTL